MLNIIFHFCIRDQTASIILYYTIIFDKCKFEDEGWTRGKFEDKGWTWEKEKVEDKPTGKIGDSEY